jgi:hypothetical protein
MATIFPWHTVAGNKLAPYIRTSSGGYFLQQGTVQKVTVPPSGAAGAKVLSCHIKGTSPSFNQYYSVKYGEWWGLITANNVDFKIVRLWELTLAAGYAGIFAGYPKKNQTYSGPTATWAAFTLGQTYQEGIGQRLPLFYRYPQNTNSYYEILSTDQMKKFPIGRATNSASPPPTSSPPSLPPSVGGGRGNNPGWDGTIPSTGPGSSTDIAIGTTPFDFVNGVLPVTDYPSSPSKTGPNKPGGVYVVGPDGKKIYLPPGLDFSGFKEPPPPPKPETKIVVRMPKGYAPPFSTAGTKPRMTQRQLDLTDSGQAIGTVTDTFIFPYIPQNIRYSDIGSDWREIPRAMNASFVDWSGYKLMKVSMDFLVSAQYIPSIKNKDGKVIAQGTAVSDGLMTSVTNELNMLRRMATNKFPVTLEGFDDILQIQMARSRFEQPRGLQFVIQDLNITAGRRTIDATTGLATTPSLISAAQVSITLQEIPVETVTIVKLPPLQLGNPIIGKGGGGGGGGVDNLGLQSGTLVAPWTIVTPPGAG